MSPAKTAELITMMFKGTRLVAEEINSALNFTLPTQHRIYTCRLHPCTEQYRLLF